MENTKKKKAVQKQSDDKDAGNTEEAAIAFADRSYWRNSASWAVLFL